ncbi:MAG: putative toxin-antitoxin system toxin component, PIN family [Acidobacteria bacterium]|nr:MAG: putative toxin-antitoxin system toxin component, PIN family [Acidobacteriota bacterium]
MIPLRLVIDTNVVVSAALKPEGLQRTVVLLAMTKPARWYVSDAIVSEYAIVLARPELKIRRSLRQQFLQLIRNHAYSISPSRLAQITADPADNIFVECADAARADYLVTGNQRHFPKFWKNTKIITSSEFLSMIAPHLNPCRRIWPTRSMTRASASPTHSTKPDATSAACSR